MLPVANHVRAELASPVVVMETSMGTITLELDLVNAPLTTANFLYYLTTGFYDGSDGNGAAIFHRVIDNFVIQGGGYTEAFYTNQASSYKARITSIYNEADNGLSNMAYTIAMARADINPHTASSEFLSTFKITHSWIMPMKQTGDMPYSVRLLPGAIRSMKSAEWKSVRRPVTVKPL
jgi:peptidyl-prolyl cis-trans isomerase B (cyclophilin B)